MGLFGGILGRRDEEKDARTARRRGVYVLDERIRPLLDLYFNKQLGLLQRGRDEIAKGYSQAETEVSNLGRSQIREAKDQLLRDSGSATSGLVGSGLYGTSARGDAARGVQSDLQRRTQEINDRLGALRSELYTNRGSSLYGADANLANLYGQRFGVEQGLEQLRYGLLTGSSGSAADLAYGPSPFTVGVQGLESSAEKIAGYALGGGFGG